MKPSEEWEKMSICIPNDSVKLTEWYCSCKDSYDISTRMPYCFHSNWNRTKL